MRARDLLCFGLLLGLAACRQAEMDPEDAALLAEDQSAAEEAAAQSGGAAQSASSPRHVENKPAVVETTMLADGVVAVGGAVDGDGNVTNPSAAYAKGSTVHASVPAARVRPGQGVTMYWFGPDNVSIRTETREPAAGAKYVSFSLDIPRDAKPGTYSAQVDIGDEPAGMADFRVQ